MKIYTVEEARKSLLKRPVFWGGSAGWRYRQKSEWVDRDDYLQSIIMVTEMLKHAA